MTKTTGINMAKNSDILPDFVVGIDSKGKPNWSGLHTKIKDPKKHPIGGALDSLNWLTGTLKDHIELRMGQALLGQTRQFGNGKITGLGIGSRVNGVQVPYYSFRRQINVYDVNSQDTEPVNAAISDGPELINNGGLSLNDDGWNVGSGWSHGSSEEDFSISDSGSVCVGIALVTAETPGYTEGNILTLVGGNNDCQVIVGTVDESGSPNEVFLYTPGTGYIAGGEYPTTGGTGTGVQIIVQFVSTEPFSQQIATTKGQVYKINITTAGLSDGFKILSIFHGSSFQEAVRNNQVVDTTDNGSVTLEFAAQDDYSFIYIVASAGPYPDPSPWTGSISNISIKEEIVTLLPAEADGEDVAFAPYNNLAGYWIYASSPHSSIYKIPVANLTSYLDLQSTTYRGYIKAFKDAMFLWHRYGSNNNFDFTGLYRSAIDIADVSPQVGVVANESEGTGDGTQNASGTLASITGVRTPWAVQIFAPSKNIGNVTAITKEVQAEITVANHGLAVGDHVVINGIQSSYNGTGTVSTTSGAKGVVGIGTLFLSELVVGATIIINGESKIVDIITDDLSLQVTTNFTNDNSDVTFTFHSMFQINNILLVVVQVNDADHFFVGTDTTGFDAWTRDGTLYGSEFFLDDKDGNLIGSAGGTGTIDYATSAWVITAAQNILNGQTIFASYNYEIVTTKGVADFSLTIPRTAAGSAVNFVQNSGGNFMSIFSFNTTFYGVHQFSTYSLDTPSDDLSFDNQIYRNLMGMPYWRAGFDTDDGILYLDATDPNNPKLQLLTYAQNALNILPDELSDNMDFSGNAFDWGAVFEYGNLQLLECQNITNGVANTYNNVCYVRNKVSGGYDKLDFIASCFDNWAGTLLGGDFTSNNVFKLFSGYDDDDNPINNFWTSPQHRLAAGLVKAHRFYIDGFIAPEQSFQVYLAYDQGEFNLIQTIAGNGIYVDNSWGAIIGNDTIGLPVVGTGVTENAYHYELEMPIWNDKFEVVAVKFVALGIGALSINTYKFKDIRYKGQRAPAQYQVAY